MSIFTARSSISIQPPGATESAELVSTRSFFGLPLYYRPRFLLQALLLLANHSDAHCAACWATQLPSLLADLHCGRLSNDANDNLPYGSPDAIAMARPLAQRLLSIDIDSRIEGGVAVVEALRALASSAGGPDGSGRR